MNEPTDYEEAMQYFEDMVSALVTVVKWGVPAFVLLLVAALYF